MNVIALERLREMVSYDQETGAFHWRKKGRGRTVGQLAGTINAAGYRVVRIDGVNHKAHRLAWLWVSGQLPAADVDHINGNRLDNRIVNLRDVSRSVNLENIRSAKSHNRRSGLLGAYPSDGGRWTSRLQVNKKLVYLGTFATKEDAHLAYLAAKRDLHAGCTI